MSGKRLLNVTVLEARQVLGIESASASDTYAKIAFIDIASRDIKSESAKTKVVAGTINPKWGADGAGESFRFGENYDLSNPETLPTMRVALFDKNTCAAPRRARGARGASARSRARPRRCARGAGPLGVAAR